MAPDRRSGLAIFAYKPTPATDRSQLPAIGGRKNVNQLQQMLR